MLTSASPVLDRSPLVLSSVLPLVPPQCSFWNNFGIHFGFHFGTILGLISNPSRLAQIDEIGTDWCRVSRLSCIGQVGPDEFSQVGPAWLDWFTGSDWFSFVQLCSDWLRLAQIG